MSKFKFLLVIPLVLTIVFLNTKCKKSKDIDNISDPTKVLNDSVLNKQLNYDDLLKKINTSSKGVTNEKSIVFFIDYKKNDDEYIVRDFSIVPKTDDLIDRVTDFNKRKEKAETSSIDYSWDYKITCDAKKKWTKVCTVTLLNMGKACQELFDKCLAQGGCVTICQQKLVYIPSEKLFVVAPSIELYQNEISGTSSQIL
jgi:hypothetical protein